jgi:hypothetical protein
MHGFNPGRKKLLNIQLKIDNGKDQFGGSHEAEVTVVKLRSLTSNPSDERRKTDHEIEGFLR